MRGLRGVALLDSTAGTILLRARPVGSQVGSGAVRQARPQLEERETRAVSGAGGKMWCATWP